MFLKITQANYINDSNLLLRLNDVVEKMKDLEKELTGSNFTLLKDKEKYEKFAIAFNLKNGKTVRILHHNTLMKRKKTMI